MGELTIKDSELKPVWPNPIPVSERLPDEEEECLFFDSKHGDWFMNSLDDIPEETRPDITHWLPLPPNPE